MGWLHRLAGVLVAPRRTMQALLAGGQGGIAEVLGWMFLVMLGTQPAETAGTILGASRGILPAAARLLQQFVLGYALLPLVVSLALGLLLAGLVRLRGQKVAIDGVLTAAVYLWVPVGVLAILGALLLEAGWRQALLPHVPLQVFLALEPAWWELGLRLGLSYGWSAWLAWVLFRAVLVGQDQAPEPVARPSRAGWFLAGWLLAAWAGGTAWVAVHYEQIRPVMAGDPAAGFDLPRVDGRGAFSLAGLRGRPVVIEFWADWCSVCLEHMPALDRWAEAHPQVAVLAVHRGGALPAVAELIRRQGWRHATFLLDEHEFVARAYRVDSLPTFFVIDPAGRVLDVRVGAPPQGWLDHALGCQPGH